LEVHDFQHAVNVWSSTLQELNHEREELSLSYHGESEDNQMLSYNSTCDHDGMFLSIIFCQKWVEVFKENAITMQLKRFGALHPARIALAA
jgi:hypothetical protein